MDAEHFIRILGNPDMLQPGAFVSLIITLVRAACRNSQHQGQAQDDEETSQRTLDLCQQAVALILEKRAMKTCGNCGMVPTDGEQRRRGE